MVFVLLVLVMAVGVLFADSNHVQTLRSRSGGGE